LLRTFGRIERRLGIVETGVRAAEAPVRECHVGIEAQSLIERARGFDPHVPVQIVQALAIKGQGLARRSGRYIERIPAAAAERYGPLENLTRHPSHGRAVGMRILLPE